MTKTGTNNTAISFSILVLIYSVIFAAFSLDTYLQDSNPNQSKQKCAEIQDTQNAVVSAVLVDQLKENNKGYTNNVWSTLGTLIGALGMVLGSAKFREILKSRMSSIPVIQAIIILLYAVHAFAYHLYKTQNARLMGLLENVVGVGSIEYYKGYSIFSIEVILNLFFDTVLFVLLVYIIGRVDDVKAEAK